VIRMSDVGSWMLMAAIVFAVVFVFGYVIVGLIIKESWPALGFIAWVLIAIALTLVPRQRNTRDDV